MSDRTRELLHRSKVEEFASWAIRQGYKRQPTKGVYEVLRLGTPEGDGPLLFYLRDTGDHATTFGEGTRLVRRWLRGRGPRGSHAA